MVLLFLAFVFGGLLLVTWIIQRRRGDALDFYGGGERIDRDRTVGRLQAGGKRGP